jgi:hypothetical protein
MRYLFAAVVLLSACPLFCESPKHVAPMAVKIKQAKSIFLIAETDHTQLHYDAAYKELEKWGRWPITDSSEAADIILYIGVQQGGTGIYQAPLGNGSITVPITGSATCLSVIDRESRTNLWSKCSREKFLRSHEASQLIKDFKKRLEGK